MEEISAYAAYSVWPKKAKKKAPKKKAKRLPKRTAKPVAKKGPKQPQKKGESKKNNGVPTEQQNGNHQKPKAAKMSSSYDFDSSYDNCGDCNAGGCGDSSNYSNNDCNVSDSSGCGDNYSDSGDCNISDTGDYSEDSNASDSGGSDLSEGSDGGCRGSSDDSVSYSGGSDNSYSGEGSGDDAPDSANSDEDEDLDTTDKMVRAMAGYIQERDALNLDASATEDMSGLSDSEDNGSEDEYDSDGENGANGETQSDSEHQFSVEYTLSEQSSSMNASSSSFSSAVTTMQIGSRKAGRRSEPIKLNDKNNNNKSSLPPAAKQAKLQAQAEKQKQKEKAASTAAPSCPLPRKSAANTMVKSCLLPNKDAAKPGAKSCRLPAKDKEPASSRPAPKSCRLSSRPADKMAAKMAAELSGQPRKKTAAGEKKESEVRSKTSSNEAPLEIGMKAPRGAVHQQNSIEEGKRMLHWLINPMTSDCFFEQYWERNACQLKRKQPKYFSQLISSKMIDEMLITHHLEFTTNIDVTSYKKGVRETLNPDGRAMPPTVWGFYGEGCSIRILNPSTYLSKLRQLCSTMQEFFHCLVGANVYLTPPNSQGFAPHYDDIEAFVLQVEGRKRWRLYAPPQPSDILARTSSGNYKQEELGQPLFDAVLEPGDILYFPRGTVHQAVTEQKSHSLHITLSVYQQQSYANLMEALMPAVLQRAIKHHVTLRRGLPLHIWQHLGLARGGNKSELRDQLLENTKRMVQNYLMPSDAQIDAAVDQLAKRFQHEALPPCIKPEEHVRTVFGSRSETDAQGHCLCDYELTESTSVRLLRANILRLVAEGTSLRIYYYVDNALEYCKYEANFMEIQPTEAAAVEALMTSYPEYIKIAKLPLRSAERRIEVATALWERGLLMTQKPFK